MKLPEKVKIGSQIYAVRFPHSFTEVTDFNGQHDGERNEIRIREIEFGGSKRPNSKIMVTFIHEILHAIDSQTGHRIFDNDSGEQAISGISNGILSFLLDNGYLKLEED